MKLKLKLAIGMLCLQCLFCNLAFADNNSLLKVDFKPDEPVMHLGKPTKVKTVTVYDHSKFSTKITNRHFYPVHMKNIIFISIGDRQKSGLGDIVNYWPWKGSRTLETGKSISLNKVWGFTVDTPNTTMTYQFKFVYTVGNNPKHHIVIKDLVLKPED